MLSPKNIEAMRGAGILLRLRVWQAVAVASLTLCGGMFFSFQSMFYVMDRSHDRANELTAECITPERSMRLLDVMDQLSQANDECIDKFQRNVNLLEEVLPAGFLEADGRFVLNTTKRKSNK